MTSSRPSVWPVSTSWTRPAGRTVGQPPADGLAIDAQQALRLVVDHRDAAGGVHRDGALADAVQHGLPLLEQAGDLARLEAEGLPLDPPRQQHRTDHPEAQTEDRGQQVDQQVRAQGLADLLLGDARPKPGR